jgi:hypothetical protein
MLSQPNPHVQEGTCFAPLTHTATQPQPAAGNGVAVLPGVPQRASPTMPTSLGAAPPAPSTSVAAASDSRYRRAESAPGSRRRAKIGNMLRGLKGFPGLHRQDYGCQTYEAPLTFAVGPPVTSSGRSSAAQAGRPARRVTQLSWILPLHVQFT